VYLALGYGRCPIQYSLSLNHSLLQDWKDTDTSLSVAVNGRDTDTCELVMHALHCIIEHY